MVEIFRQQTHRKLVNRSFRFQKCCQQFIGTHNETLSVAMQKPLSFAFDFVASDFLSPAWRNWQTRWTQNPVAARPCGFEPLRRQLIFNSMVRCRRREFDV
jgi:hypothetical protein